MWSKTKIAMCAVVVIGATSVGASAGIAKTHNPRTRQPGEEQIVNSFNSFAQHSLTRAPARSRSTCWVPMGDDNDDYGEDTRGLGYWGSCNEKGSVRFR